VNFTLFLHFDMLSGVAFPRIPTLSQHFGVSGHVWPEIASLLSHNVRVRGIKHLQIQLFATAAQKILIRFPQELNCVPVAPKKQQLDYYVKYTRLPSLQITRAFGRLIEKVKPGRL